jgi:TonB family protein
VVDDEPPAVAPLADATADIERALDTPWTARSGSRANTGMGVGSGGVAGASPRAMSGTGDGKLDGTGSSSNPADPPIAEASAPPPPRAPVLVAALLIEQPRPVYPRASLRANEQGSVLLRLHVGADGAVGEVEVVEPSGFPRLDEAALAGVKLWRFRPATSDGVAIASLVLHRVTFKMSEAPR